MRDVDQLEARELAGTEGAKAPFWSPDSRFIGFVAGEEIRKISVQGGPSTTICRAPGAVFGASWSPNGESIAFGASVDGNGVILEVPSIGGQPKPLFEEQAETAKGSSNDWPHFLPAEAGARSMLLRISARGGADTVLKNLETGAATLLIEGSRAVYSPSGHVVYERQNGLWALPFSLDTLEATGEAFPVLENSGRPSVAIDGTLVSVGFPATGLDQLVWRDRGGRKLGEIGQPKQHILNPVLSPDGRSVAAQSVEGENEDIWVHEVGRPLARRLTFDDAPDARPQWSSTGLEIMFQSERRGKMEIFRRAADGTGEAELLVAAEASVRPYGWSQDGNYFVYSLGADLWYLKRQADGRESAPLEFLATPFNENAPSLSPDGNWVSYCSNQSGEYQVYVRPFPSGAGQSQVSTNGGCQPRWSRDGKELYYVEGDTLMAVEVKTSPVFEAGLTTTLFSDPHLRNGLAVRVMYDVSADGRFVLTDSADDADPEPPSIQVVENWYEEFRDRE